MTLFDYVHNAVKPLMHAIHHHPFNLELAEGILPENKFIFYLQQDASYLKEYSYVLALTAMRLTDPHHAEQFRLFTAEALEAEKILHRDYLMQYEKCHSSKWEMMPVCFMYTHYLLSTASLASVEEAVASILPCFWVYREVGSKMLARSNKDNPYHAWIAMYSGEAFDLSVQKAIDIMNNLADQATDETKEKMIEAFVKSTELEWMFWDAAYHTKTWEMPYEKNNLSLLHFEGIY